MISEGSRLGGLVAGGLAVAVALAGMLARSSADFERIGGLWLGAGLLLAAAVGLGNRSYTTHRSHRTYISEPLLALFAGYVTLRALVSASPGAMAQAMLLVLGILAAVAVADLDARRRRWVIGGLVAVGAFEAILCIMQGWFLRDPILAGWQILPRAYGHGTLGSPNVSGAWLAIVIGFAPVWLLPLFLAGILATGSVLGGIGAAVALAIRFRHTQGVRWSPLLFAPALVAWRFQAEAWAAFPLSWRLRGEIWGLALATIQPQSWAPEEWLPLVIGFGPGSWATAAWPLQLANGLDHWGMADRLHNEPLQWLFEGGVIGVGILAVWGWTHRRLFRAPAVAALAVQALAFHPLHVPATGILAVVVIGLAMGDLSDASDASDMSDLGGG